MNLANLSIKRPIFITCIVILTLAVGVLSLSKLPINLFPDITFPVVSVTTPYPGAGPEEIETLVSRPIEDELSSLGGIKRLTSYSREGVSIVVAEFSLDTDIKYAEQQVRDRMGTVKRKLPEEVNESTIRRIDPADQPILLIGVTADLPPAKLFDFADRVVRPKLEQVNQVGLVDVFGGRKREIHVNLDRAKLKDREISASQVAARIQAAGQNVPAGKLENPTKETVVRTLGEFKQLDDVKKTIVNFVGNDVPVTVADVGTVTDTLQDEKTRVTLNGKPALILQVYRQSGANTVQVSDAVKKTLGKLNDQFKTQPGSPQLSLMRDGAKPVRANVKDVEESIFIGIILTIVVVFFFLGSGRSTLITGLALPNSLIGAFILMAFAGFSINLMTLLALSLAVGLLIDDAIVVRENIFRHVEMGKSPIQAALDGTKEVTLAVVATTLTVIAVFGPIAFLQGVVGQFFKEFGLTVCFAMAISLFDALTMAPMLSAYYAGTAHGPTQKSRNPLSRFIGMLLAGFGKVQDAVDRVYEKILKFSVGRPLWVIGGAIGIFLLSLVAAAKVPKTFLPASDAGEFAVDIDLPPGTSLSAMTDLANKVDSVIRGNSEVETSVFTVGTRDGESNKATAFVLLTPFKSRTVGTSEVKERLRGQLKEFAFANPKVRDIDIVGGGQRPFSMVISGNDLKQLQDFGAQVLAKIKDHPALKDVDISYRPGKPEFQVALDLPRAQRLGVSTTVVGQELRTQVEGATPAVFRESGEEYDIRVRLQPDQRDIMAAFTETYVPNINQTLVKLSNVANPVDTSGLSNIDRMDRGRMVTITADIAPDGPGIGGAIDDMNKMFANDLKLPEGMRYTFVGQAENFQELIVNMIMAAGLGILFIYLVLSSLYESFITPFTIMLVLPLAACGAFFALYLGHSTLDIFSMIGCIMLLGVATKNSILLVDYAHLKMEDGMDRTIAMLEAGRTRLRPILMTSFALVAGMLPLALGLNEASKQRVSLGIAVIGGIVSSTLLTLVVVPAAFSYIDRFRVWSSGVMKRIFLPKENNGKAHAKAKGSDKRSHAEPQDVVLERGA